MSISMTLDLVVTLLLGSVLFFACLASPTLDQLLDFEPAGAALHKLFSRYCLWGIGFSTVALVLSFWTSPINIMLLALVLISFVYCRQFLIRQMAQARDKWLASDQSNDKIAFNKLRKHSMMLSLAQVVLLLLIVVF